MPCRFEFGKLRPWTYHCLFGLLSVSGLRLGEARNLELQDVDLKMALLTIRNSKFGKSRLVPLHASTCEVLVDYMARRERHWEGRPVSSYLFVSSQGNRLDGGDIHRTFYALSRQIGLRGISDNHGPRLHDMRHRFATNTLVTWYRSNQDPECLLPILSAYLGHVHVEDTQWYLSSSPELMREAMGGLSIVGRIGHDHSNQLSSVIAAFLYTALDAAASGEPTYHQFLSRHLPPIPEVYPTEVAQAAVTSDIRRNRCTLNRGFLG
jgi:integrase